MLRAFCKLFRRSSFVWLLLASWNVQGSSLRSRNSSCGTCPFALSKSRDAQFFLIFSNFNYARNAPRWKREKLFFTVNILLVKNWRERKAREYNTGFELMKIVLKAIILRFWIVLTTTLRRIVESREIPEYYYKENREYNFICTK